MKFVALLKKDLRESLPWMLLAAVVLLLFGSMIVHYDSKDWWDHYNDWQEHKGSAPNIYYLGRRIPMHDIGPLLLVLPLALGVVLGARQFWVPSFDKTWAFCLHRSVKRSTILWSRFAAAGISFVVALGVIWTGLYAYACRVGVYPIPPTVEMFIEGWIFILLGLAAYCGTALSGLSRARWYTTRLFGIASVIFIVIVSLLQMNILNCLISIAIGLVILVSQIIHTFLHREF